MSRINTFLRNISPFNNRTEMPMILYIVKVFILYNILRLNLSGKDEMTAAVFDMRSVGSSVLNGGIYGIEASVLTAAVLAIAFMILLARKTKVKIKFINKNL